MRLRWYMLMAAVAAVLALGALSCGGDDDDDSAGNGDAATATADEGDGGDDATAEPTGEDQGGDGGADGDAAVDACSLITPDEAEDALGVSVGDGVPQDIPPIYSCEFASEETAGFESVSVTVIVYDNDEQAEDSYQLAIDINDYEEFDGVGERAYYALGFGVTALQGKYEVSVSVIGPDDATELEKDLAKKAVDRLP